MKELIAPKRLQKGDTVAFISLSGGRAFYGPNVLTPIAQPGSLDGYTSESIRRTLFEREGIGEVKCSEAFTPIEWREIEQKNIKWIKNDGYRILQGNGVKKGRHTEIIWPVYTRCVPLLRQECLTKQ